MSPIGFNAVFIHDRTPLHRLSDSSTVKVCFYRQKVTGRVCSVHRRWPVFTDRSWRVTVFFRTLPIPFLLHQRKLMYWKKLYCSESVVLQSLSRRKHQAFVAVGSLYNVLSSKLSNNSENWYGIHLPCLRTCDLSHVISVLFYVFNFFL